SPRPRTPAPPAARDDGRGTGRRTPGRAPDARAGRGAAGESAGDRRHSPRARLLMESLRTFGEMARRPERAIDLGLGALLNAQILVRMLANLRSVYVDREAWSKARAVLERLMLLDPETPGHVRDYGTVLMKEGDFARGASQWERYLALHPDARDAKRVKAQLTEIRRAIASLN